ncbi:uncharacterized protein LOC119616432 [Lucilia sericata]|uniref:uncharacterized protein LOC119616432 n=1 Tax=Lucilia sericata TaxID=13632 RepID=UPI0018A7FDF5|nr:uncharacterized protein LOC119616432 [Lucilia sericata]
MQSQTPSTTNAQNFDSIARQRDLELQKLEEEMQIKRQYLPTFNGDPDDWPLFISSFENSTSLAGYTDAENLIRLQSALKGKARDMVKNKLLVPQMVPEIIRTLRMCFGRPEHILERVISKAKNMPPIKDKLDTLIEYAMCVRNICATMECCQMQSHLNNPLLVKELVDKLPNNHKLTWAMCYKDDRVPITKSFSDWLYYMAEAASNVTPLFVKNGASVNTHNRDEESKESSGNEINKIAVSTTCIVCNDGSHKVAQCDVFKSMSLNRKWECVKAKNLCRQCLGRHRHKCNINKECGIDGCKYKHNPLLHKIVNVQNTTSSAAQSDQQNSVLNAHSNNFDESQPLFRIIPINIHAQNKIKKVYAFLDEGSAVTLIEKSIFEELGLQGKSEPLCLRWTGDTTRTEDDSVKATITISSVTNNKQFKLNAVHTVNNLGLSPQTIDADEISRRYPYLSKLPIQSYSNAIPAILIGADNWKLAVPLKIREGSWNQPIASKTRLGWALQGNRMKDTDEFRINVHFCDCQKRLHDMVKETFNIESTRQMQLLSYDDNKAMAMLENTCKKVDGHYEVGLLWRNQNIRLPDSFNHRLNCLQKKFFKTPLLKATIQSQIDNLVLKGYAKKLTPKELEVHHKKTWYLPIFVVSNPNKPNKVRLVWDAAAKSNGTSLNDYLLTGPDLLNPLVSVLLNFRVGKTAICGDISEMFHRVNVREIDMHAQRFLWYDKGDTLHQPSIYVMRALIFGISCAPCIAHFVRNKNADLFKNTHPRAVEAIQQNHYVDDFIDSECDDNQALELAIHVREIHEAGGFKMHNWTSNSEVVLKELHGSAPSEQSMKDWGSTTKILGLYWDPNNDEFRYICRFARLHRDILNQSLTPTKRETLQVLMSIFDPLGFVSCYTIGLKILIQEIWRTGIAWDEELTDTLDKRWCSWKSTIQQITSIRIPLCYSPTMQTADEVQLHTFVDASENAYAAICYLLITKNNVTTVSLVAAKSKVAPLKPLSIPKLELQAALLGTRLAKTVQEVRRINTNSQFWWSDAKTVLRWLQIDPKKFQQFVMHRVGQILENTNVNQWRWVPSKQNPADLATKVPTPSNTQMWFHGPKFLRSDVNEWPQCDDLGMVNETEMKRSALVIESVHKTKLNIEYFSNWKRLYRAVATFFLYCHKLNKLTKDKIINTNLEVDCAMIEKAKTFLMRYAQNDEYSNEISSLTRNKLIGKTSKLISLNVYLDKIGIIRCRGRAEYLNNHEDAIVLPPNHHVTFLLVRHFHEMFRHQNHETALNEIRSEYYIPKLRVLFRKVRRMCQWCKINYAKPLVPQMAALPIARLAAFERPFTYVGVDYFGPLNVAVGRRHEKRWGVIFTCLTVRAIHIEVSHSLDTSSCIMSIKNFISRRGTLREIYSDNGTNFKAAEKLLCCQLKNVNSSIIQKKLEQIKWKFNPPAAPHMGGAWERLVKSIKTVLYSICPTMKFNDESLKCALCEVEFTINCRPLTFVSIECCDDEAITPNHLLLGSSNGYKPIADGNMDLRQRWYKTQEFADQFWRRWLKEYVPIISRRSKWFTKQPPIKVGDVVIIVDSDMPRNCWPKGVVVDVAIAKDGQVRRATVKTEKSILQRPVAKLAVLDVGGPSNSKLDPPDSFTEEGTVAATPN